MAWESMEAGSSINSVATPSQFHERSWMIVLSVVDTKAYIVPRSSANAMPLGPMR